MKTDLALVLLYHYLRDTLLGQLCHLLLLCASGEGGHYECDLVPRQLPRMVGQLVAYVEDEDRQLPAFRAPGEFLYFTSFFLRPLGGRRR